MSEVMGVISRPSYRLGIALSLPLSRLHQWSCSSHPAVCGCCHRSPGGGGGGSYGVGPHQHVNVFQGPGSFSSCQHSSAHRFKSLKWSIIFSCLFAASLPAATPECHPVVVVVSPLWFQCMLHCAASAKPMCLFPEQQCCIVCFSRPVAFNITRGY